MSQQLFRSAATFRQGTNLPLTSQITNAQSPSKPSSRKRIASGNSWNRQTIASTQPSGLSKHIKTTSSAASSSTDSNWPLQLWDQLAEHATITLNLIRTSHIDPTKSAYHQLHGHKYDWNSHSMAPPGTRAVIYLDHDNMSSWGARGLDA